MQNWSIKEKNIDLVLVSMVFIAGAASQAGDADSFRVPGLTSGLHGSVNVHHGTLLLVPQWQCISSFVYYILGLENLASKFNVIKETKNCIGITANKK